jgi:hypothetical protein
MLSYYAVNMMPGKNIWEVKHKSFFRICLTIGKSFMTKAIKTYPILYPLSNEQTFRRTMKRETTYCIILYRRTTF